MTINSKINVYPGIRFYTQDGLNVTENVKLGKTQVFTDIKKAENFAFNTRSYLYPVYAREAKDKYKTKNFYGYAIPK